MFALQAFDQRHEPGGLCEDRKQVQLLVGMVVAGGSLEIAHHLQGTAAYLGINAVRRQPFEHALQQGAVRQHALMAGGQQSQRV